MYKTYDEKLDEYLTLIYPKYKKMLDETRAPYIKEIDALGELHLFQNYLLDFEKPSLVKSNGTPFALFYTKIASDVICVKQCLMLGQLLPAISIERNIFETFIDTKIITERDTSERMKLYEEFGNITIWQNYEIGKKYLKLLKEGKDYDAEAIKIEEKNFETLFNENELLENYNKIKENYNPKKPFHWAWKIYRDELKDRNPSIEFLCKKLNLYEDYFRVYKTNSLAVHNSPLMANIITKNGGLTSTPIFSDKIRSIAGLSFNYAIEVIMMILEFSNAPNKKEIESYLHSKFEKIYMRG